MQILASAGAGFVVEQHVMKVFLRQVVGAVESVGGIGVLSRWSRALGEADIGALGEKVDRFDKGDAVDLLDKHEDIASDAAAGAVVDLAIGVDAEGRGVFLVERAETEKVAALLGELDVFGDHVDDIGGVANALENVFGYAWHC